MSLSSDLESCPLVEIVHFHKVLRGEMAALVTQYQTLRDMVKEDVLTDDVLQLEQSAHAQFHLLWSVFKAHSVAEDNTIWPALNQKQVLAMSANSQIKDLVEDHDVEERYFEEISLLLARLRACIHDKSQRTPMAAHIAVLMEQATNAMLEHLNREETTVLPVIQRCFTNEEMADLVGQIMGHRSSEMMQVILSMMVRQLSHTEREDMLKHMQTAVRDTFFERWLSLLKSDMSAIDQASKNLTRVIETQPQTYSPAKSTASLALSPTSAGPALSTSSADARLRSNASLSSSTLPMNIFRCEENSEARGGNEDDLSCAMKEVARCEGLSSEDKSRIMQCLRNTHANRKRAYAPQDRSIGISGISSFTSHNKRMRANSDEHSAAGVEIVNGHKQGLVAPPLHIQATSADSQSVEANTPLFAVDELEPSYHSPRVLGCSHYTRGVKLLAPCCGHLFVCRLCHDEQCHHALDRYSVSSVLCMYCKTLQPSTQYCKNEICQKRLARYHCSICNLFDDDKHKSIYHCPYCNVCRKGRGLGDDFYHCMRCNACVCIAEKNTHRCISHSMERSCPICQHYLFDSVEQLKGLRCGHVMHLSCFMQYRIHKFYCPLCHKTMEDMSHEWDQLDTHVRSTALPAHLTGWRTAAHCYDCNSVGVVQYRLDYHKCSNCGSYNTRLEGAPFLAPSALI